MFLAYISFFKQTIVLTLNIFFLFSYSLHMEFVNFHANQAVEL